MGCTPVAGRDAERNHDAVRANAWRGCSTISIGFAACRSAANLPAITAAAPLDNAASRCFSLSTKTTSEGPACPVLEIPQTSTFSSPNTRARITSASSRSECFMVTLVYEHSLRNKAKRD